VRRRRGMGWGGEEGREERRGRKGTSSLRQIVGIEAEPTFFFLLYFFFFFALLVFRTGP